MHGSCGRHRPQAVGDVGYGWRVTTPADTLGAQGERLGKYWWLALTAGILSIIVGIVALVYPGPTLLVVGIIFGAYLVIWGVMMLFGAAGDHAQPSAVKVIRIIIGILGALVGVVLLIRPDQSVLTLAFVLAFWFVFIGILQLSQGFSVKDGRAWNIVWGIVGIVAGVIILAQPEIGLVTLVFIVSFGLIVQGIIEIPLALAARKVYKAGA
jgi:uncharacterized membrane protein HdeD (DUF308 family)